jgi:hypothetical protein
LEPRVVQKRSFGRVAFGTRGIVSGPRVYGMSRYNAGDREFRKLLLAEEAHPVGIYIG